MRWLQVFSGRAVMAWARAYTFGLPADSREHRLGLIRSDIWEETHDPSSAGSPLALLARMARGMADDITWRLSSGAAASAGQPAEGGEPAGGPVYPLPPLWPVVAGAAWAMVVSFLVRPVSYSLALAGAALAVVALIGWALDLRRAEGGETGLWPLALAVGIAGCAGGFVLDGGRAGLLVAFPGALLATAAWLENARGTAPAVAMTRAPVPAPALAALAAAGDVIVIERPSGAVSRRGLLRLGLWAGLGASLAAFGAQLVDFMWQRTPEKFGGPVVAGALDKFPPGSKTHVVEGKFWLVNLTEEEGGPGFLALWHKCPHLGCTVPWEENFAFSAPGTNEAKKGWFRCPCHQSTYTDAGVRVYGPAPRSMDRMEISFDRDSGRLIVDTGKISKGDPENAKHAFHI